MSGITLRGYTREKEKTLIMEISGRMLNKLMTQRAIRFCNNDRLILYIPSKAEAAHNIILHHLGA